ncbi:MAG: hypothetical protein HN442_02055 [Halieaceae bacterium]|jgi:hypothetical protein|nr:hypothetical protein [Halieaceae bacterium]MBT7341317.1 hypothetical protein [Halieaceae bacterium]
MRLLIGFVSDRGCKRSEPVLAKILEINSAGALRLGLCGRTMTVAFPML